MTKQYWWERNTSASPGWGHDDLTEGPALAIPLPAAQGVSVCLRFSPPPPPQAPLLCCCCLLFQVQLTHTPQTRCLKQVLPPNMATPRARSLPPAYGPQPRSMGKQTEL